MYNPTNSLVSVLCQHPCGSSSSEVVKESLTGGHADENDTLMCTHIVRACVRVCEC